MSTDRRIKSLKTRQKSLLTSFQLVMKFVDGYKDETDSFEVPVRLEHLVTIWNDFNAVQGELETLDDTHVDAHLKDRIAFETSYFKVKGFLLSVNKAPPTPGSSTSSQSNSQSFSATSHVRLPDIKLPVFDGTLDRWLNFHDLFISLVHSSHELSNIQKYYYLRSSLTGEALKLVQTIAISANNYMVAWNLLLDHYQNPIRLKQSYIDSLFEFSPIKRESAAELHSLAEKFEANVKILKQLGEKTEFWDLILIRMLSIRLDTTTRRDWEEYCSTKEAVKFQDLTTFIQRRVTVLQTMGKTTEVSAPIPAKKPVPRPVASHGANQVSSRKCLVCSENHPLYQCATFSKMNIDDKEKEIRRHQLCRNCLRKGHQARDCSSSSTCRRCRGHHHTQLCTQSGSRSFNANPSEPSPPQDNVQPASGQTSASVSAAITEAASHVSTGVRPKRVLLATAVIIVIDDRGREHAARALLDSGSECSFVTESFSQLIKARRRRVQLPISGIGQSAAQARSILFTTIRSRVTEYSTSVELLVMPKVTIDLPSTSFDVSNWKIPPEVQLADPAFSKTSPIDIVLGAELFFDLFSMSGRIDLGNNLPALVNSVFGWVVTGRCASSQAPVVANLAMVADLHQLVEKFWSIEEDATSSCFSVEEVACEEHFQKTFTRNSEGRYIVRLPVKENILDNLGDNRRTAVRRFRLLEGRLASNENLREQYCAFMDEYFALGHMERVQDYQQPLENVYHLPHHAVIREDSTTTKVRVVFDASCRTTNGPSLNDALMVGPILQQELRSILMRSRIHPVMIIADMKQMFRQILVDPRDSPLLRIVFRSSMDAPLETFELKTVTYGTACAPFLATRVLKQLADDERNEFPEAAMVLTTDFYVDDLISGASSIEEAIALRNQLNSLLSKGGFQLRKWASNKPAAVADVSPENLAMLPSVDLDLDQCIKTLGLHWEPLTDCLRYKVQLPEALNEETLTKRTALSYIARLFDPLGLVGPVVTTAKLFMQSLWLLQDNGKPWNWDRDLPSSLQERWRTYQNQLPLLNDLRIDRLIMCPSPTTVQLHIFSDASEKAYGACAYIRSTGSNGLVMIALLTSRSKVAPLKQQSIPRLELCGALLATELYQKIIASLPLQMQTFFWVDSTTVLSWLKCNPSTWTTFVANRVSKIQLATENCSWNHIAGQENPADILSRGATAESLLRSTLWWSGPTWLQLKPDQWPIELHNDLQNPTTLREARKVASTALNVHHEPSFVDEFVAKFSNYQRMLRITCYCKRFLRNCRSKTRKDRSEDADFLHSAEIKASEITLIALIQQQAFPVEWAQLSKRRPLSTRSRLRWFNPFMSDEGIIRIGGRLTNAQQSFDSKHQILLPAHHPFSLLLVKQVHERNLHAHPQLLLTLLRNRYWIIGARSLARKVVHTCIACFRAHPKKVEQFMADLPPTRVTAARPFAVTGVDYWGPVLLRPATRRSAARKAYVAVFVCFCTKAVHIELVVDLTTAKFMQAFRRFTSRRGLCSDIFRNV